MTYERQECDVFVHNIQQDKMKELWDNKEDEAWNIDFVNL